MKCPRCSREVKRLLLVMEDTPGVGPERKDSCFSCVSRVAEEEMRLSEKATCPECGRKSVTMTVHEKNRFDFTCEAGHSWSL